MAEVSVIVPVYNTKAQLTRCVNSLLEQTFSDIEILLIDDGSTDGSLELCGQLAELDSRVRLIAAKHAGVGAVRNRGLEEAGGKYIMFCDSDDYTEPRWIETLLTGIRQHPNSLVNCEYADAIPSKGSIVRRSLPKTSGSLVIDKAHFYPLTAHGMTLHLWTRIFSADIIRRHGLTFMTDMYQGEDIVFIASYLQWCDSIFYIAQCLYYWTDNDIDTLSRAYQPHCYEDLKKIFTARKPLIDESYMQLFYDDAYDRALHAADLVFDERNKESEKEKYSYYKAIFSDPAFRETATHASREKCGRLERLLIKMRCARLFLKLHRYRKKQHRDQ